MIMTWFLSIFEMYVCSINRHVFRLSLMLSMNRALSISSILSFGIDQIAFVRVHISQHSARCS